MPQKGDISRYQELYILSQYSLSFRFIPFTDLTDEEKIVIGVCVGVGGLALLAIVIVLCYMLLRKNKNRKKR